MNDVFVLAEHRRGVIRNITWEMLGKSRELASTMGSDSTAVLLGHQVRELAENLAQRVGRVLVVEDKRLENFNSETYQQVLSHLIREHKPILTLIGHTGFGMDLAPALATELGKPLSTDCLDLYLEGERLTTIRQMYCGKVNAQVSLTLNEGYVVTVRPGALSVKEYEPPSREIETANSPLSADIAYRRFIEYVEEVAGEIDITRAEILVAIGQGIGEARNISLAEELAQALGGSLACSRPIVDKKWLPKYHQVGTSGKTVSPKVYIALGISGAFQHLAGMKGSGTIIAINKDPKAPIFGVADYGLVEDVLKVIPLITEKVKGLKAR